MSPADLDKRPHAVAAMFDQVAERYDLMNDLLALGQTRLWRRAVTQAVAPRPGQRVLDLAAGTGTSSEPFRLAVIWCRGNSNPLLDLLLTVFGSRAVLEASSRGEGERSSEEAPADLRERRCVPGVSTNPSGTMDFLERQSDKYLFPLAMLKSIPGSLASLAPGHPF